MTLPPIQTLLGELDTAIYRELPQSHTSPELEHFYTLLRDYPQRRSKVRQVDVSSFDGAYIRGFCHLRQKVLTFRLDKVEEAQRVASSTPLFG